MLLRFCYYMPYFPILAHDVIQQKLWIEGSTNKTKNDKKKKKKRKRTIKIHKSQIKNIYNKNYVQFIYFYFLNDIFIV